MTRPSKQRFVGHTPEIRDFKPRGVPMRGLQQIYLPLDGLEAMRLIDLKGLDQAEAAVSMGVSRQTLGRILARARRNVTEALTHGHALRIEDEDHHQFVDEQTEQVQEEKPMKIAVSTTGTTLDSPVDPHFGRAAGFLIVDPETVSVAYVSNDGAESLSHGAGIATAEMVANAGANVVLTGSVGPKAFRALYAAGLKVGHGVDGMTVRAAIEAYRCGDVEIDKQPSSSGHGR